jgi:hypothetical protein
MISDPFREKPCESSYSSILSKASYLLLSKLLLLVIELKSGTHPVKVSPKEMSPDREEMFLDELAQKSGQGILITVKKPKC